MRARSCDRCQFDGNRSRADRLVVRVTRDDDLAGHAIQRVGNAQQDRRRGFRDARAARREDAVAAQRDHALTGLVSDRDKTFGDFLGEELPEPRLGRRRRRRGLARRRRLHADGLDSAKTGSEAVLSA